VGERDHGYVTSGSGRIELCWTPLGQIGGFGSHQVSIFFFACPLITVLQVTLEFELRYFAQIFQQESKCSSGGNYPESELKSVDPVGMRNTSGTGTIPTGRDRGPPSSDPISQHLNQAPILPVPFQLLHPVPQPGSNPLHFSSAGNPKPPAAMWPDPYSMDIRLEKYSDVKCRRCESSWSGSTS